MDSIFANKYLILRNYTMNNILNMSNQTNNKKYSQHN